MRTNFEGSEDEFWNKLRMIIREEMEKIHEPTFKDNQINKSKGTLTSLEPEVSDNGRYTIGETCKILKLSFNTIKKYTDQGAIRCGIRKSNGRKFYTGAEIKRFWKATY